MASNIAARSREILFVPIGDFDRSPLRCLQSSLLLALNLRVRWLEEPLAVRPSYHADRAQVDSRDLLRRLEEIATAHDSCVVGITATDLFASVFTFVFGEAHLSGRTGVVSLHRLRPEAYGFAADPIVLQDRLSKEVLHEVGHLFGLVHCHHPECVMGFSAVVEEIDNKGFDFCDDCLERVEQLRAEQPAPRPD